MKVKDIMTRDPACCTPDSRLSDVARMMLDHDCGQIPVVDSHESKRPVGVVTDRDIVVHTIALGKNPVGMMVREVMSTPAVTIRSDAAIEECCRTLEDAQVRRLPVIDEHGCCCGMIALADIAQNAPEHMTVEVVQTVSRPVHA